MTGAGVNVVVPMAGRGSRFADEGETTPKPLIDVLGRPMVSWAMQSVADVPSTQLVFVVLEEHEAFGVKGVLKRAFGDRAKVVAIPEVTAGQACTVLAARAYIDNDSPLLIASSDTWVRSSIARDIEAHTGAGLISVCDMPGDRWSFAKVDPEGRVTDVAEKVRISDHASTGLYHFSSGARFCATVDRMVAAGETTRGEYYVIPVYKKLIEAGEVVGISIADEMWDMGTPASLKRFVAHHGD